MPTIIANLGETGADALQAIVDALKANFTVLSFWPEAIVVPSPW